MIKHLSPEHRARKSGWTVIRIRECEITAGDFDKLRPLLNEGERS